MKIKGSTAFLQGIGMRNVRAAIYAWFFNFVLSLFVYLGYYKLFKNAAGESIIAGNIEGEVGVYTLLADTVRNYSGNFSLVFSLALLAALLYFLISIFLAGGIYSALVGDERTTFANLLASSVENFFSMLKIFVVNLLNWVVALFVPGILFFLFIDSPSLLKNETVLPIFTYSWLALTLLILTFSTAVYDFSRIIKLKEDRGVFNAFKKGIKFTFTNKLNVLVIFLLYALSLAILYLVYSVFINLAGDILYVPALFIVLQVFVMVRYFLKVVVMRAEVVLTQTFGSTGFRVPPAGI
jgi:hypothetical protein